jgi:hypothetical protein
MPRALVIELTNNQPQLDWHLTTASSHGNTVRATFLHFAESGWTCDVRLANYSNQNYGFYDYVSKLTETPYDLVICSWRMDEYYLPSFARIVNELGVPTFLVTETRNPYISGSKINTPIVFVGANENFKSRRIDTWDIATNLSGNSQNYPSYANGVIAGKSTKLIDNGFSAVEIKEVIQEQAQDYPEWTEFLGYGQAPESYELITPEPEPEPPEPEPEPEPTPEPPFIPSSSKSLRPAFYL